MPAITFLGEVASWLLCKSYWGFCINRWLQRDVWGEGGVAALVVVGWMQDNKGRGRSLWNKEGTLSSPSLCASDNWHLVFVFLFFCSYWVKKSCGECGVGDSMQTHTRAHTQLDTTHWETGEKKKWGSCENIASRYQKRLERKYGAIFYSSLPVRVSKESPVHWTFIVHTCKDSHTHTQTLWNQNPGVTEWVVNICLFAWFESACCSLFLHFCCRSIFCMRFFFFLGEHISLWPHFHYNINKWFHAGRSGKLCMFLAYFGTRHNTINFLSSTNHTVWFPTQTCSVLSGPALK